MKKPKKNSGKKKEYPVVNGRELLGSSFRQDYLDRANLCFQILTTDKTPTALAREFGISLPAVAYYKRKLRGAIIRERKRREPFLRYNPDGSLFFDSE